MSDETKDHEDDDEIELIEEELTISRTQAAARLRRIADELERAGTITVEDAEERDRVVAEVGEWVEMEIEVEMEEDEASIEIEITWKP